MARSEQDLHIRTHQPDTRIVLNDESDLTTAGKRLPSAIFADLRFYLVLSGLPAGKKIRTLVPCPGSLWSWMWPRKGLSLIQ